MQNCNVQLVGVEPHRDVFAQVKDHLERRRIVVVERKVFDASVEQTGVVVSFRAEVVYFEVLAMFLLQKPPTLLGRVSISTFNTRCRIALYHNDHHERMWER